MIRVTIYNEYIHEQEIESIHQVYPNGIHGCIADFLQQDTGISTKIATFEMKEHGLSQEVLDQTDVLIYWSHAKQEEFSDSVTERIKKHVEENGMGIIALHSAHYSKMMRNILGTSMTLSWRDDDRERLFCCNPNHPIAAGVAETIEIPHEEMYGEYFDIPKPDDIIYVGWFKGGEVFRSGCTFTRGKGRIFYFQPGHEAYPVYYMKEIQKIICNAVYWCAKKESPLQKKWMQEQKTVMHQNIHVNGAHENK